MEIEQRNRLNKLIRRLEQGEFEGPGDPEEAFLEILGPLLSADGYELQRYYFREDPGVDHLAKRADGDSRAPTTIAIACKYYHRTSNISVSAVEAFLRAREMANVDRLLLISNVPHTEAALRAAEANNPFGVELLTMGDLREWVARQGLATELDGLSVDGMLRALSRAFARRVARDPDALQHLEWRDAERLLAEVFDGLGFDVELTPPAKDGGKDLILNCVFAGTRRSFIVEVKHWRSGHRVGPGSVTDFLRVIVRENRAGGVFLSTYGFTGTAFEGLSQVDRQCIRFGAQEKIVGLCTTYLRTESGLWTSAQPLPELLFEGTTDGSGGFRADCARSDEGA